MIHTDLHLKVLFVLSTSVEVVFSANSGVVLSSCRRVLFCCLVIVSCVNHDRRKRASLSGVVGRETQSAER